MRKNVTRSIVTGAVLTAVGVSSFGIASMHASAAGQHYPYQYDGRSEPAAVIDALGGVETRVDIDAGTAKVLADNGVSVAPVGPATATKDNGTLTVHFPIIGGEAYVFPTNDLPFIRGDIFHSGGLTFSAGAKSLTVTNFTINPDTSLLSAQVGGNYVPLFELDGQAVQVGKDAAGHVTLDGTVVRLSPQAATALNTTFGVSLFKEGIPVGVAHIVAGAAQG